MGMYFVFMILILNIKMRAKMWRCMKTRQIKNPLQRKRNSDQKDTLVCQLSGCSSFLSFFVSH